MSTLHTAYLMYLLKRYWKEGLLCVTLLLVLAVIALSR